MAIGLTDEQRRALELTGGNANMFADTGAEEPLAYEPPPEPAQLAATEAARTSDWRSGTVPGIEEAEAARLADGPPAPETTAPPAAQVSAPAEEPTPELQAEQPAQAPAQKPRQARKAAPAPRQESVPVDDVEDRIWNPNASSRTLRGEQAAGQNRALDLEEQTKGAIKAEGAERKAAELGELRNIQREGREGVAQRVALNREQKQQFEQRMMQRMDELSDKMRNPPKDTMGMVMGIVAAAMAAKGDGRGAAISQGLGQAFGGKMKKWEAGLAADQQEIGHLKTLYGMQNDDSESELKQEAQLSSLAVAEFDSALRQVGEETQSKEARAIAEQARLDLRNKYVAHALDIRDRAAQQQAAGRQDVDLYKFIASQPTPELRAAAAAQFGSKGQQVLQNIQKSDKGAAEIDSTTASTEKTRIEAAKSAAEIGPDGKPAKPLTEGQQKLANIVSGAAPAYNRINKLFAGGGEVNRGATKETWVPDVLRGQDTLQQRADAKALAMAVLRAESGSAISDAEIEAKYEALPINSGDPDVRKRGFIDLLNAFRALDNQGSLGGKGVAFKPDGN